MFRTIVCLSAVMLMGANLAEATCSSGSEVWSATDGPVEIRAYKAVPKFSDATFYFEGRIETELVWRVEGSIGCSNGIVLCSISIPMSAGDNINVPVTWIYEDTGPQYIVFADLSESVGYAQYHSPTPLTIRSDIFDVKKLAKVEHEPPVRLPNYYRFIGCSEEFFPVKEEDPSLKTTQANDAMALLQGLWRTEGGTCVYKVEDDGRPVVISGTKLDFYEASCVIEPPRKLLGAYVAALACSGEGYDWSLELKLQKDQSLLLTEKPEPAVQYERCPAAK